MGCHVRKTLSWFLLLGVMVFLVFLGIGRFTAPPAAALIVQQEESANQMLYQSRQTLKDRNELSWQAIAFKRIYPNGEVSFKLRLVGFPGAVEVEHPHPLTLRTSLEQTFTATDVTQEISPDSPLASNVGQYDLQPILPQLSEVIPLQLSLPTTSGSTVVLDISPDVIQEWQAVAAYT
ncbi:DUF3122 domain-containing protein [Acaryochloris sp. CCMEE 5410]|uniref:DUF3122 domain-containing protein n=1 Tax=Acaryochloris sp. CCMEE 5410 TaxID=310037 RepID=UPI0002485084|nr:DUF3122 domain-containing protein [Acaryochloris sp. CCMEE 5410]KAI9129319.1 DUF3122 domain-containing protein [Acaryochloris sp. CCMEE 5410]